MEQDGKTCVGKSSLMTSQLGMVVWITGLSGAGKSTLAAAVSERLRARGDTTVLLDGDELRTVFGVATSSPENHGREVRLALAWRYARLCRVIACQGVTVVIATISLFKEVHEWNRHNIPRYFEVFLNVPIKELRQRDPKAIYQRFDAGEISAVAGLDVPIDIPEAADWNVEFEAPKSVNALADELLRKLEGKYQREN